VCLFLADESPNLVKLKLLTRDVTHDPVQNTAAALPDTRPETHDRITMNARHTLDSPDSSVFRQEDVPVVVGSS
jgi:hypothetical protein